MNKTIFPELLGSKAKPEAIIDCLQQLSLPNMRRKLLRELDSADKKWNQHGKKPAKVIAQNILESI